jgi:PAS domain S-box-containing protein
MRGSKNTILVVDDEPESLRLLTRILANEGYQVHPSDSGELALASVSAEPPDLILLDIRMRGMDGFEVCRRIKACEECRQIPLMFISAAIEVEERVEGLALGAVDFVSKPFRREELLARVRTHVELSRLRAQLEMQVAQQTAELRAAVKQLQLEVAERQRTEIALRETEERFRATFFQAAVGIAQTSLQGEWLLLNNRFSEIVGYTQAELRGKTFVNITHPDDREANIVARRQFLAGEISSWSVEKRYIHKNGATVWARVHVSLVRDQHHVPQYFISVVEDVTDRVEAERALRDSERRLALAQSAGHLGLWSYDLRTKAIVASRENFQLYGLPADHTRLTYEEWLRLIHPDDRERVKAAVQESIEGTHVWDTEFRAVWPDGSVRWLLGKGTAFLDDSGQPVRLAGVNLDITERKRAEEVRSHLAAIVESSDDAIISKTLDGVIMSWNPGAERIYGYKAEEMVGLPISSLVPPEHPDEIPPIVERLRRGERLEHYETTRVRKDGRRIEVSITISPIRDSTGAVLGASVIARDITEQKQAEATLRESEERFRNLANSAPVMIWIAGVDKLCSFFNKGWLDFTGHTMEHELGNGWANGVHPDDLDRCFATYSSSFDARSSFRMEYRLRRADGEYRWVLDNGVPIYKGSEFTGYIGSCIDVTEQKLVQDRLQASERRLIESEERLKSAQQLAHVGNWVWDIKADRVYWSEELCRIFGRPPNYAPDYQGFLQAVQSQERERVDQAIRGRLAGKKRSELEFQTTRPDGEVRTVACISEVVRDAAGSPVSMSGACQDVTDQRRAEAAAQKSRNEIAHLNRVAAMGELTASLAHELNQPLAAILSNAQAANRFLDREAPDLAQVRECLTDIVADDKRAGEVIKTLRALLRKGESQASLVDLNEVVTEAIRLLGSDAMLRHASVKFEPLPALRLVRGDRTQLYQVVLNLIVNGLEATAERPPDNRWVLLRTAESDDDRVQLTVEDSGKGIVEGDLTRVFEPFYTTKQEGLGMGLSISRTIVHAHGGRIWAENSAGRSTIFHCVLPVAQQATAASANEP